MAEFLINSYLEKEHVFFRIPFRKNFLLYEKMGNSLKDK